VFAPSRKPFDVRHLIAIVSSKEGYRQLQISHPSRLHRHIAKRQPR